MTTGRNHQGGCPRLGFWDAGDEIPCTCSGPTNAHCPTCGRFVANAGQYSIYCRTCMDGMVKDYEVEERERGRIP